MADWWQWSQKKEKEALTFAVVGVGRFGTAVCRELISTELQQPERASQQALPPNHRTTFLQRPPIMG